MSLPDSFKESRDEMEEYVERIGDVILVDISNQDNEHVGYLCEHGDYRYLLVGSLESEFFQVRFQYNLIQSLASPLDESTAEGILEDTDVDRGDEDVATQAAMDILERMSPSNRDKFRYHLMSELTTTDAAHEIITTDSGAIIEFRVHRKIFPDDESFGCTEFNHSVQTVVSAGHNANQFISQAFDLDMVISAQVTTDEVEETRYIY